MRAAGSKQGSAVEATQDEGCTNGAVWCEDWAALKGCKVRTESTEIVVLRSVAEYALYDH